VGGLEPVLLKLVNLRRVDVNAMDANPVDVNPVDVEAEVLKPMDLKREESQWAQGDISS
jgi:hypothetical protein